MPIMICSLQDGGEIRLTWPTYINPGTSSFDDIEQMIILQMKVMRHQMEKERLARQAKHEVYYGA